MPHKGTTLAKGKNTAAKGKNTHNSVAAPSPVPPPTFYVGLGNQQKLAAKLGQGDSCDCPTYDSLEDAIDALANSGEYVPGTTLVICEVTRSDNDNRCADNLEINLPGLKLQGIWTFDNKASYINNQLFLNADGIVIDRVVFRADSFELPNTFRTYGDQSIAPVWVTVGRNVNGWTVSNSRFYGDNANLLPPWGIWVEGHNGLAEGNIFHDLVTGVYLDQVSSGNLIQDNRESYFNFLKSGNPAENKLTQFGWWNFPPTVIEDNSCSGVANTAVCSRLLEGLYDDWNWDICPVIRQFLDDELGDLVNGNLKQKRDDAVLDPLQAFSDTFRGLIPSFGPRPSDQPIQFIPVGPESPEDNTTTSSSPALVEDNSAEQAAAEEEALKALKAHFPQYANKAVKLAKRPDNIYYVGHAYNGPEDRMLQHARGCRNPDFDNLEQALVQQNQLGENPVLVVCNDPRGKGAEDTCDGFRPFDVCDDFPLSITTDGLTIIGARKDGVSVPYRFHIWSDGVTIENLKFRAELSHNCCNLLERWIACCRLTSFVTVSVFSRDTIIRHNEFAGEGDDYNDFLEAVIVRGRNTQVVGNVAHDVRSIAYIDSWASGTHVIGNSNYAPYTCGNKVPNTVINNRCHTPTAVCSGSAGDLGNIPAGLQKYLDGPIV